jgi:hypothetical protein
MTNTVHIRRLSEEVQNNIEETLTDALQGDYYGASIDDIVENALDSRLIDLYNNEDDFVSWPMIEMWANNQIYKGGE